MILFLTLFPLLILTRSITFDEFIPKQSFHVKESPTQLWTGQLGNDSFFIKNAVKLSNSDPRTNAWNVPDTYLVLNEILCSKVYKMFSIPVIHHFLITNENDPEFPRYLLGSKRISYDRNVQSYRHSSLYKGFLVDVLVLNDDITKDDNVMYIPKKHHFIRSDVGGGGYYTGLGSSKKGFMKSVVGQVHFMLLNENEWRQKHLDSLYLKSLTQNDFDIMWDVLVQTDFTDRLQQVKEEMKNMIEDEFFTQDHSIALQFVDGFLDYLNKRYHEMMSKKKSIQSEFVHSIREYQSYL